MHKSLPYTFSGTVVHGEKLGKKIGFPTANFDEVPSEIEIDPGVYYGVITIDGKKHHCLPYFGPRFIFGENHNVLEIFIYDFDGDLYGQELSVQLKKYIRPPMKFENVDKLIEQLKIDKKAGDEIIKHHKPHHSNTGEPRL